MEKNLRKDVVVPASVSLVGKEGYGVDFTGVLVDGRRDGCKGIISMGRPAGEATEVITQGRCKGWASNASGALVPMSPLCVTGPTSVLTVNPAPHPAVAGTFVLATVGTHHIRAISMDTYNSTGALIELYLLGS
jgi:hypothetical protein